MAPKFAVGEVVILQSVDRPELNGEYTVYKILERGDPKGHLCRFNPHLRLIFRGRCHFGYIFQEPILDDDGVETCFGEPALRKKHQPGELSFNELMDSLVTPKLIEHKT